MCCSCCGVVQQKVWIFLFSTLFLVLGIVLVIWWPDLVTNLIYKELPLSANSRTYDLWSVAPIPVYMHIYLFNWTNSEEAHIKGVKPHFEEIGPFVFREEKKKEDIIWHANKTVSFFGQRTWYFEPEMSAKSLDVPITCVHVPSLAASYKLRDKPKLIKVGLNRILNRNGGGLYKTHTAGEWIFDSFYDEFLDYAMKLNSSLAPPIESNKFAYFLNRNDSKEFDGLFTIHTGQNDLRQMGEIKYWNGLNHTGFFDDECGRINGSTGDLWTPNRAHNEYITIFVTDTCRIINLIPSAEVEFLGIRAIKYETKSDTFDNGQRNPDMKCYCPKDMQPSNCPASGATNIASCRNGIPMHLSHPHFLYADDSYANTISGLSPNYDKHSFYIIMEPKLGVPLVVRANVMLSLYVRNDDDIRILRNLPDFYAPILTISSQAEMPKELATKVKLVLSLDTIGFGVGIALICIGGILGIIGVSLTITHSWYGEKKLQINQNL